MQATHHACESIVGDQVTRCLVVHLVRTILKLFLPLLTSQCPLWDRDRNNWYSTRDSKNWYSTRDRVWAMQEEQESERDFVETAAFSLCLPIAMPARPSYLPYYLRLSYVLYEPLTPSRLATLPLPALWLTLSHNNHDDYDYHQATRGL